MSGIFLSLGSNLGNKNNNLLWAINNIRTNKLIKIKKASSFYATKSFGLKRQPDFINAVIQIETELSPENLLFSLQFIEEKMGRKKFYTWGPRNIDIDIIFFNDIYIKTHKLIVPHPQAKKRLFVLEPLLEISPGMVYPGTDMKIADIAMELKNDGIRRVK